MFHVVLHKARSFRAGLITIARVLFSSSSHSWPPFPIDLTRNPVNHGKAWQSFNHRSLPSSPRASVGKRISRDPHRVHFAFGPFPRRATDASKVDRATRARGAPARKEASRRELDARVYCFAHFR